MKLAFILTNLICIVFLTSCQAAPETAADSKYEEITYSNISPSDAQSLLAQNKDIVLLDVRTQEEHLQLRIPESLLIPYDKLETYATEKLPDKNAIILVYCRSGRRSVLAAQTLVSLGYVNVKNLGGILDWPFETVSGEE